MGTFLPTGRPLGSLNFLELFWGLLPAQGPQVLLAQPGYQLRYRKRLLAAHREGERWLGMWDARMHSQNEAKKRLIRVYTYDILHIHVRDIRCSLA